MAIMGAIQACGAVVVMTGDGGEHLLVFCSFVYGSDTCAGCLCCSYRPARAEDSRDWRVDGQEWDERCEGSCGRHPRGTTTLAPSYLASKGVRRIRLWSHCADLRDGIV